MNYTISSSVSRLLALQKTLKFRISVGPSEVLVRPSDLHPSHCLQVYGNLPGSNLTEYFLQANSNLLLTLQKSSSLVYPEMSIPETIGCCDSVKAATSSSHG